MIPALLVLNVLLVLCAVYMALSLKRLHRRVLSPCDEAILERAVRGQERTRCWRIAMGVADTSEEFARASTLFVGPSDYDKAADAARMIASRIVERA